MECMVKGEMMSVSCSVWSRVKISIPCSGVLSLSHESISHMYVDA